MEIRHATHPDELSTLSTSALRERFLVENLFVPGEVRLVLSHHDRMVIGGVLPAGKTLSLPVPDQLRAQRFCDRREVGIVCVDGTGTVTVDSTEYAMSTHDVLYAGAGTSEITFAGEDAAFYLVSTPAPASHPTALATAADVEAVHLGEQASANVRTIRKYIHAGGVQSNQLVLGITTLAEGSVWNTMPAHTHDRRSEIYLYFGLGETGRLIHLCGRPDATRSMIVADRQAVISPSWSVHCGAGTASYSFVWAMGGENLRYDDVEVVAIEDLR